ncbi:hypothetical protein [Halomonas organivorans]|uniref:Uncharacterized protein n=1 Tax=Halomonas organivorans TaxID=257772 RepID=A0A7W5C0V7_9GAMM|nr:hypothetical protein [Halomonas organivorans]MBB3142582.1 hypothetical protein [Halomonas organivorans]
MSYQPSLEDMAVLVEQQPEHFSSPVQTLRSLRSALQQGDNAVGQVVQENTVRAQYEDYLNHGGQPLTESPITTTPEPDAPTHDSEFGGSCVECASLTPCIKKVEVVCHGGDNHRVTLQGGNELEDTDGTIYFVAHQFVTGEGTLEDFLEGTQLKDEGQVAITLDNCSHGEHRVYWTDEIDGTVLSPGTTTTVDFTLMTEPVSPITIPPMGVIPPEAGLAVKAATMLLGIIMNRTAMISEQRFRISHDGTNDFCFTSVTLPQLKFDGLVTVAPPSVDTRPVGKREGRALAAQQNMGPRVRQVTAREGWGIHAGLTVVCGAHNEELKVGTSPSDTITYDTGPSLHQARNQRQQQSMIGRFIGTLSDASQRIAQNISATESDGSKLFSFYSHGPELMFGATTEQAEEEGTPGASWKITPGLSIAYECGIRLDIYEALKRVLEALPLTTPAGAAGRSLLAFLEDAESGRDLLVIEYGFTPSLFMEVGLGIGPSPTEDTLGSHMLRADYSVKKKCFENEAGQISIKLGAVVGGGMMGYFDSLFTEKTVFKYSVEVATSGSIDITIQDGQWGYQLSHAGAMLRVQGYKKADVESSEDESASGGNTRRRSAQVIETADGSRWQEDGSTHSYRLAESWEGEFHAFT